MRLAAPEWLDRDALVAALRRLGAGSGDIYARREG